eukprot:4167334-Ditylum_brightwellii.AAC.1
MFIKTKIKLPAKSQQAKRYVSGTGRFKPLDMECILLCTYKNHLVFNPAKKLKIALGRTSDMKKNDIP